MPGNEVGDRVHNFFAQDLSQGQNHSQVVDASWSVPTNNQWGGNQRQIGLFGSSAKDYNLQQADTERAQGSHTLPGQHGMNFTRPLPKNQLQNQQPTSNGFMFGNKNYQTNTDETNFLGVDLSSNQRNLSSRSLSFNETHHRSGSEHQTRPSGRSEASDTPASFDLFGGQQQMNHHQASMLQSLQQQQQSGLSEMQQLQQQVMLRKMQDYQRQQQFRQLDGRQQSPANPVPPLVKQASGNHPPVLMNGIPNADALNYHWATDHGNSNWLQRVSPAMQTSSGGVAFPSSHAQPQRLVDLMPQQADQSLYGVPVSASRGSLNQYPQLVTDLPAMQQMAAFNNSVPGSQYALFSNQVGMQDGNLGSSRKFEGEQYFGHTPGQAVNIATNMENMQQGNAIHQNTPLQNFEGREEPAVPHSTLQEKPSIAASSVENDVALDPTEEKILFGSDDNIWAAFGKDLNMGGEAGNSFDGGGSLNAFPSLQSGSWSALMQSAVAETSSSDLGLQDEWSGLNVHSTEVASSVLQGSIYNDGGRRQIASVDGNLPSASSRNSGCIPLSDNAHANNNYQSMMGSQQYGKKHSYESGQGLPAHTGKNVQSSEDGNRWSNCGQLQEAVVDEGQVYGNTSHSFDAAVTTKNISGPWRPVDSRTPHPSDRPNDWNVLESGNPGANAVMNRDCESSSDHYQGNNQKRVMQGEAVHVGSMWKSNSIPRSSLQLEPMQVSSPSPQMSVEGFGLNAAAGFANSSITRTADEANQLPSNNFQLNYWRNVNPMIGSKGGENLGAQQHISKHNQVLESSLSAWNRDEAKAVEFDSRDRKESSNDSMPSNLSHHTSSDLRENAAAEASDSRSVSAGKQKSSNDAARRMSSTRKFQYHPMGNLDEDTEPSYGTTRWATHAQNMSQQSSHFAQSKFLGQISNNSMEMRKGQAHVTQRETSVANEVPSQDSHLSYVPNMSTPSNKPSDMHAPNKASQSSQNMLELLHKVDQSSEPGLKTQLSCERDMPSEMPDAENSGGSVGRLQRSHSSASQGFGLQLGPPSQRMPVSNHLASSQSSLQTVSALHLNQAAPELREKGQTHLAPTHSAGESFSSSREKFQEFRNSGSGISGHAGTESPLYKMPGNFPSPFNSGFPNSRSPVGSQQTIGVSAQLPTNQQSVAPYDKHAAHSTQRNDSSSRLPSGQSVEASLPDATESPNDNPALGGNGAQLNISDQTGRVSAPQILAGPPMPASQPFPVSGISHQGHSVNILPNMWTNVSAQQQILNAHLRKLASHYTQGHQSNILDSTSPSSQHQGRQDVKGAGNHPLEYGANLTNSHGSAYGGEQLAKGSPDKQVSSGNIGTGQKMNESQGLESIIKSSNSSPANSASTQRDIEAFGRSLKPNNFYHQNYSLLNQMQAMKNAEIDPNSRVLKRMRGPDGSVGGQQLAPKTGQSNEGSSTVGDALVPHSAAPPGDSRMLSFTGSVNNFEKGATSQRVNVASRDVLAFGHVDTQGSSRSNNASSTVIEHSQISPQMAPSWFNQYGTFKNGQMLPMYDARKAATLKSPDQPFTLGKSSSVVHTLNSMEQASDATVDTGQVANVQRGSTPPSVAMEQFLSPHSLPQAGDHQLAVLRPKKRKSAIAEFSPWHKEVSQGSGSRQTISMAEMEWAKASIRLTEKVEDNIDLIEDGPPMLRPKRRLILTTQLMQQIFRPPPAAVLCAPADLDYESVAYSVSRLALGDACTLICGSSGDADIPLDNVHPLPNTCKTMERFDDKRHVKIMEEFMDRARKIESAFLRLDKRASVSDLRLECQELEKFSVINRFAKFHGRGQADNAESSSSDAAPTFQKACPQRYVTALPMPRSLPDRVQCFSL